MGELHLENTDCSRSVVNPRASVDNTNDATLDKQTKSLNEEYDFVNLPKHVSC